MIRNIALHLIILKYNITAYTFDLDLICSIKLVFSSAFDHDLPKKTKKHS